MKRRILSIATILVMAFSIFSVCCLSGQAASAASKSKVYSSTPAYTLPPSKDKDGSNYIWAGTLKSGKGALMCAKSASGKAKTLDIIGAKHFIANTLITNGNTIFYAIVDDLGLKAKTTFYKTTVNRKYPIKIKTVTGDCEPAAYHKGKLYYVDTEAAGLYWCDISKKVTKTAAKSLKFEKTGPAISSYGKYIIRSKWKPSMEAYMYLYNLETKKQKRLPDAAAAKVYGDKVYCCRFTAQVMTVYQCNLSGTKKKKIASIRRNIGDFYMGKKAVWFTDENDTLMKLSYKTGKVIKAK